MGLESGSYIDDLNSANPLSNDNVSQGDDHLRLIKSLLKATFPGADKEFYFPRAEVKADDSTENVASDDENKAYSCTASSSGVTINLPTDPNAGFKIIVVNNNGGANVTINRGGSDTINGSSSYTISDQYEGAIFVYVGSNVWFGLRIGVGSATRTSKGDVEEAAEAEVYAATDDKFLDAGHLKSAAAAAGALSESSGTIAVDWESFIFDQVTIDEDTEINNPTNEMPGTWRTLEVVGDDGTDREITFGSEFEVAPEITDCNSTNSYVISMFCLAAGRFRAYADEGGDPT